MATHDSRMVWGKFPGCEQPWCYTLHTAAVDMPGSNALPADQLQIVCPSADNRNQ